MTTRVFVIAMLSVLLFVGVAGAQHPLLDMIANKVVEVPAIDLRAIVGGKSEKEGQAETRDGTGSDTKAAQRSPAERRVHQQSRGPHYQQDVPMRHDSLKVMHGVDVAFDS